MGLILARPTGELMETSGHVSVNPNRILILSADTTEIGRLLKLNCIQASKRKSYR